MRNLHTVGGTGRGAALVLALAAAAACAAEPRKQAPESARAAVATDTGRAARMHAMMFEGITLSPRQQATVDSIHAAHMSHMGPAQSGGDHSQMRQMMEEQHAAIRNVLTPEQQRIFDANVERMRQGRGRGRGGPPGPDSGSAPSP